MNLLLSNLYEVYYLVIYYLVISVYGSVTRYGPRTDSAKGINATLIGNSAKKIEGVYRVFVAIKGGSKGV